MKIWVDGEVLFEITDVQKKVLAHLIPEDELEEDIKRRLKYIITHKYKACLKKLKEDWDDKLEKSGVEMIPTNREKYAELVFKQPGYKGRGKV